jgi:hypothetical protein
MPTDGTLLLEHMPKGKQYLLTALSVFFSFGSVLSAVVGIIVIPPNSCAAESTECNVDTDNLGWKYLLMSVAVLVRRPHSFTSSRLKTANSSYLG